MVGDEGHFCRVTVDHKGPVQIIERLLSEITNVSFDSLGKLRVFGMRILVDHGDSHPPVETRDYSDWLNWKYSLEVVWTQGTSKETCAEDIRPLLHRLNNAGVQTVPACDFEDLLGPYQWTSGRDVE